MWVTSPSQAPLQYLCYYFAQRGARGFPTEFFPARRAVLHLFNQMADEIEAAAGVLEADARDRSA